MKDLEQALTLWQQFSQAQLAVIQQHGSIPRNDPVIWNHYLHRMTNQHWRSVLTIVAELIKQHPQVSSLQQRQAVAEAIKWLLSNQHLHSRCLDTEAARTIAWRAAMAVREIYCQCEDLIANEPPNSYNQWFE